MRARTALRSSARRLAVAGSIAIFAGSPGSAQPPDPNIDDVVLNELLFNPHDLSPATNSGQDCDGDGTAGEDGGPSGAADEFIELFNTGTNDVDLSGYCLSRETLADGDPGPGTNNTWLIPNGVSILAGESWHVCGGDDGRGFGFAIDDPNGDRIRAFRNAGSDRAVALYQPSILGDCDSGVDTVIFSIVYPTNESNGESYKRCPDDGTSPLGYYDDANGFFFAPTPGGPNCDVATPAVLERFVARSSGYGVEIEWAARVEGAVAGFNIYGGGESPRRLNAAPVARSGEIGGASTYRFDATTSSDNRFWLAAVDLLGREQRFGPFALGEAHRATPATRPIDWRRVAPRERSRRPVQTTAGRSGLGETPSALAELRVQTDGIHRVTYDQLLAAGIDLAGVAATELALAERNGPPVPIRVLTRDPEVFAPGDAIEFLGRPVDSLYTRTRVYLLSTDAEAAARIAPFAAPPSGESATSSLRRAIDERQSEYSFASPTGDPWFERRLLATDAPVSAMFEVEIDHLVPDPRPVEVEVVLWGGNDWRQLAPDHHVEISLNGTPLGHRRFDGLSAQTFQQTIDPALLTEGVNALEIALPADTGGEFDLVHVDRYSIVYPSALVARSDRLHFRAAAEAFEIDGFSQPDVVAYRRSSRDGVWAITGLETTAAERSFRVRIAGSAAPADYYLSTADRLLQPTIARPAASPDEDDRPAELVVIVPSELADGLTPFVDERRSAGVTVGVVELEALLGRWGAGAEVDPGAIRSYVADAYRERGTEAVLLVGADSYDPLDHLGLGSRSWIPAPYVRTDAIVRFAPADALYGDIDSDGVPEVAVGRWPVRSPAELDRIVTKTADYRHRNDLSALFVADGGASFSFAEESDRWIDGLPPAWQPTRAYVDELGPAGAREELLRSLDSGVALTTYFGHSSYTAWSNEVLLTASDAASLANAGRPSVVLQFGCWNTYHVEPRFETLGSALLTAGDGGAAAAIGAAALAPAQAERDFGRLLFEALTSADATLGSALVEAKRAYAADHPERLDILLGITLLGDPTLELPR